MGTIRPSVLDHPYWDLYSELTKLRKAKSSVARRRIVSLANEAGLNVNERLKVNLLLSFPWSKVSMVEETFFLRLREKYGYSVLSMEMLETIGHHSPLVELGAGNGYNAWLLQQMGVEVVAIDAFPVEEGKNWFFNTHFGLPSKLGCSFTEIKKGDSKALANYSGHTLLMCWPPKNPMALRSLTDFPGEKLIFVGNKQCCADRSFYKKLSTEWHLDHSVKTGSWDSCHTEWLEIHSRVL